MDCMSLNFTTTRLDFSKEYVRFTDHLPLNEKKELKNQIYRVKEASIQSFVKNLNHGLKSEDVNFNCLKDWSNTSLRCFVLGKLNFKQVASVHMLIGAIDQIILNPFSILYYSYIGKNSETVNQSYINHIRTLPFLKEFQTIDYQSIARRYFSLNKKEWKMFCELMNQEEISEQKGYLLHFPQYGSISPIYNQIINVLRILHPITMAPETRAFIPSFSMLQNFLKVKALLVSRNPIELEPVFGPLTCEDVEIIKKKGKSPFGLYLPERSASNQKSHTNKKFMFEFDGWYGGGAWVFWLHDFYHAIREQAMSEEHSAARFRMASLVKNDSIQLYEKLVDGELIFSYPSAIKIDEKIKVISCFYLRSKEADSFGKFFSTDSVKDLWNENLKTLVLQDMVKNSLLWNKKYNITKADLEEEEKDLYDQIASEIRKRPLKRKSLPRKAKKMRIF